MLPPPPPFSLSTVKDLLPSWAAPVVVALACVAVKAVELRLPAGRWSVSTEARKGSTVLAKSVRRVTLATPKPVAVKPEAVTG